CLVGHHQVGSFNKGALPCPANLPFVEHDLFRKPACALRATADLRRRPRRSFSEGGPVLTFGDHAVGRKAKAAGRTRRLSVSATVGGQSQTAPSRAEEQMCRGRRSERRRLVPSPCESRSHCARR